MEYVVVESLSRSQEVVTRDTLKVYDVLPPESILDLGLRHEEQTVEESPNSILAAVKLIDTYDVCPRCGDKLKKRGFTQSNFHAVFTDHKIGIQKHQCCILVIGKCSDNDSVFGTSIHPDLARLQCEQGTLHSYREAQTNLEKLTVHRPE